VHEFGPSPASVGWFGDRCAAYTYSHHWPDVALGTTRDGVRCEDLTRLTFDDASFDVVVTQDVFEHLPDPAAAAAEIARVLAPGGVHVATVPIYGQPTTQVRAILEPDGTTTHVVPPEYHGNPVDDTGSLVFRRWGDDVVEFVERATGLPTERVVTEDRRLGLAGTMLDVLVSTKPHATRRAPATDAAR
jgi:SAM-dependent methyltransferase